MLINKSELIPGSVVVAPGECLSRLKSFMEKNYQYEASFQDDSREILNGLFSTQEAEEDGNPEEDEDLGILMELDEDQE